ncbi:MAG: hypothetical protein GXP49_18755 [Deltaproteobacteria bacterium]|nr:hypothetical protein [Deltaproteobacteria bacterium]
MKAVVKDKAQRPLAMSFTALFTLGLLAAIVQILIIRELLVVFGGNEVVFGLFYFSWFAGITLGAYAGIKLTRKLVGQSKLALSFTLILSMLWLLSGAVILALRTSFSWLMQVLPGGMPGPAALAGVSVLFVIPPAMLIGALFPLGSSFLDQIGIDSSTGAAYWMEGTGAAAGGLIATFVMVPFLDPISSLMTCGIFSSFLFLLLPSRFGRARLSAAFFLSAALLLFFSGYSKKIDNQAYVSQWKSRHKNMTLVKQVQTHYQFLQLGKLSDQYTLFADGLPVSSFPDQYAPPMLANLYMCEHPSPKRVLIIGGLSAQLVTTTLKYSIKSLDVAELDPGLVRLIRPYLGEKDRTALKDPRVRLILKDGRRLIKQVAPQSYDLVIVSVPQPTTAMLNRYYTVEFFEEVRRALAKPGVFVITMQGYANYLDEPTSGMVGPVYRGLSRVFPSVVVTGTEVLHIFAATGSGIITSDPKILGDRWDARNINSDVFSRYHFSIFFPPGRRAQENMKAVERAAALSPANKDTKPLSYLFGLVRWEQIFGGSNLAGMVSKALSIPGIFYYMAVLLLVFATMFFYRTNAPALSIISVASSGFTGISLSMAILYSYQVARGLVYSEIGLIVATFMAGIAIGGGLSNRLIVTRPSLRLARMRQLALSVSMLGALGVASGLFLPWLQSKLENPFPFLFLSLAAGAALGSIFPIAAALTGDSGKNAGWTAGALDAADNLGALIGGALTGVILLPLLGLSGVCILSGTACLVPGALISVFGFSIDRTHRH